MSREFFFIFFRNLLKDLKELLIKGFIPLPLFIMLIVSFLIFRGNVVKNLPLTFDELVYWPGVCIIFMFLEVRRVRIASGNILYTSFRLKCLAKQTGQEFDPLQHIPAEVWRKIDAGEINMAKNLYQEMTGASLKEADYVIKIAIDDDGGNRKIAIDDDRKARRSEKRQRLPTHGNACYIHPIPNYRRNREPAGTYFLLTPYIQRIQGETILGALR